MPIFTTAVSGSGTNRLNGLEHGGVASHFTGSVHIFSGSFPGQMGLNVTGSAAASSDLYLGGNIYNFVKIGDGTEVRNLAISIQPGTSSPRTTFSGDIRVDGNRVLDGGGTNGITFDGSGNTAIDGNLKVTGNVIQASDGGSTITMDTDDNVTIAGDLQIGGDVILNSEGEGTIKLDADQKVGIGVDPGGSFPSYALDVNGDIRIRGNDIRDNSANVAIRFDGSANTEATGTLTIGDSTDTSTSTENIDVPDVSGTDITGKSLIIKSGAGTGAGAGGTMQFQVSAAGSAGSSVNSHTTLLTLDPATGRSEFAGSIQVPNGDGLYNGDGEQVFSVTADQTIQLDGDIALANGARIQNDDTNTLTITEANTVFSGDIKVEGGDIYGPDDLQLRLRSDKDIIVKIDSDNDETDRRFMVWNQSEVIQFSVGETGNTMVNGNLEVDSHVSASNFIATAGNYYADAGQTLTLNSPHNILLKLDTDNNGSAKMRVYDGGGSIISDLDESGNLTIGGDIRIDGDTILDSGGNTVFNFDGSGNVDNAVDFSSNVTVAGNLDVSDRIRNIGDTNTQIRFLDTGKISMETSLGGMLLINANTSESVFNEGGGAIDFRVEGDNETHLIFADASSDRVGIGNSNPQADLHVTGDVRLSGDIQIDGLDIKNDSGVSTIRMDSSSNVHVAAHSTAVRGFSSATAGSNISSDNYWTKVAAAAFPANSQAVANAYILVQFVQRWYTGDGGTPKTALVHIQEQASGASDPRVFTVEFIDPDGNTDPNWQTTDFILTYDGNSGATHEAELWVKAPHTSTTAGYIYASILGGSHLNGGYNGCWELQSAQSWAASLTSLGTDVTSTLATRRLGGLTLTGPVDHTANMVLDAGGDIAMSAGSSSDLITMDDGTTTRFTFNVDSTPSLDATGAFTLAGSSDITLDATGDIVLSADGDQISMDDGTTTRFTFNVDSTPQLDVTGDFTLDCTGDITLDCAGHNVEFSDGGVTNFNFTAAGDGNNTILTMTSYDNGSTRYPYLILRRSAGTDSSKETVADGDLLGVIQFQGYNSSIVPGFDQAANIKVTVDGTPGSSDSSDMPGRMSFSTSADGSSTPTERLRISSAGELFAYAIDAATGTNYLKYDTGTDEITYQSSTEKIKKNIEDLELDYAPLLALRPRTYDMKDGSGTGVAGFVAEEVFVAHPPSACLGPDLDIDENGKAQYDEEGKRVRLSSDLVPIDWDQRAMIAYLVKIIQDLHARIEILEG